MSAIELGKRLAEATERPWPIAPAFEQRAQRRALARTGALATVLAVATGAFAIANREAAELPARAELSLLDGSVVQPDDGAEISVVRDSLDATEIDLRAGRARFDVTHRPERAFVVHAGASVVRVLGTQFIVERLDEHTIVTVEHGSVSVDGALIVDGESVASTPRTPAEGSKETTARRTRVRPPDLLERADAARATGELETARELLERYLAGSPSDERVAEAAFALGKVLVELGDEAGAARRFRMVWEKDPSSPLAAPARARERDHSSKR